MFTSVTMNLSDDELMIVDYLCHCLNLQAKTDAVGEALRIARVVAMEIQNGNEVAFVDPESSIAHALLAIPGLHRPPLQ